ncbi:diguanylate cyclase/phosphodiesterase [Shewanella halifaxensis HAW-EB4]|uniref:Diguanylate cyclase/phosphodiesterase n=1 Tax=Shewanella halifaxensis (strain HAW-EB4) TaxID=458817 RepID=B0TL03_SHEHH|nr:EAL domain-containing protein [Shewanella halifaxensis]ABZ77205.1 diguanylate cyclase/phosphodiesterase [Shewanella halifaxensis HAW-EB4]
MNHSTQQTVALRQYLTGIIGNAPFGILTISEEMEISIINADAIKLLGLPLSDLADMVDIPYSEAFVNIPELQENFETSIIGKQSRQCDLSRIKANAYILNIKCRSMLHGTLVIIENVTKQAELEDKLLYQATHDNLTKLANRKQFEERLKRFIAKSKLHTLSGAVIFIDIDRFKPVNDTAGHAAGDELLKRVTAIMKTNIRERDTLARLGGDEFSILLEMCSLNKAVQIAEKIRKEIESFVFTYGKKSFKVGISAGISLVNVPYDTVSAIINAADNACQIAKNNGRNRVHVINLENGELEEHIREVEWLGKLNWALASNQFVIYAQKICAIGGGEESSHFEVLIRLKDEDGMIISPGVFIPPAERYDLMPDIDRWVLKATFSKITPSCNYSINLSGQTLSDDSLINYIENLLDTYNVNPKQICFEITETAAIQELDKTVALISCLKQKGFCFSLDDFGSGLSSFSYLKKLPVNYLKIDGDFVKDIATDSVSYAMVKSINEVGHTMGLKTIAEFVESEAILAKLTEIGVDYVQGYYIHEPQPFEKLCNTVNCNRADCNTTNCNAANLSSMTHAPC